MINKKTRWYLTTLILIVIMINSPIISAGSFDVHNYSIDKFYAPEAYIKGWVNISLSNMLADALFTSSTGNEITLIDLLKTDKNYNYTCSPTSCESAYAADNGELTKSFDLNSGESVVYGLKFTGEISRINTVDLTIESDATSSCANQLKVDFLDDGSDDLTNMNISSLLCSTYKRKGCFDLGPNEYSIGTTPYCQKINLPEAPGFELGAWVKKESEGDIELNMELFDLEGYRLGDRCELTKPTSSSGEEISCEVEYLTEPGNYYVCIYSYSGGTGNYKVRGDPNPSTACGFYGNPSSNPDETSSYDIFAQPKKFANFGEVVLDSDFELSNSMDLSDAIDNYVWDTYENDCSDGCAVPIKFTSAKDQTITLSGLSVQVDTTSGSTSEDKFYDLTESNPKISSDPQKLKLDKGNFTAPSDYGQEDFQIKLDGDEVFEEEISVERVSTVNSLIPTSTAAGYPTEFKALVTEGVVNITKYEWSFGDGEDKTTTTNKVIHSYNSTGTYELEVTVVDKDSFRTSRTFDIVVGSPKEIANVTLEKKRTDLQNVKATISGYSDFVKEQLEDLFGLLDIEDDIAQLQRDYGLANTDAEYTDVMVEIAALNVPQDIKKTKITTPIAFYPKQEVIDIDILEEITAESAGADESEYIEAVYSWNDDNLDTKIKFTEYSAEYEHYTDSILSVFELEIKEKSGIDIFYDVYIIVLDMENLDFAESYDAKIKTGYTYIKLGGEDKTIVLSTTEESNFEDLEAFISPSINRLPVSVSSRVTPKESPWWVFAIILIVLIAAGIGVYFGLQSWYKHKYERHLFKNKNDLYNILQYIHNAKVKGLKNKEIMQKLKKAGWKTEQINYGLKKYTGKRTGLPGPSISLGKKFGKKQIPKAPSKKPSVRFPSR